jgi:hypothetical protein
VDWDSPPTYGDYVNDEDPIEEPLATDLEEEYEEYGLHPIFGGLYTKKDDQLEDEEPTYDVADYEEGDEEFLGEVPNFNGKRVIMLISLVLNLFSILLTKIMVSFMRMKRIICLQEKQ